LKLFLAAKTVVFFLVWEPYCSESTFGSISFNYPPILTKLPKLLHLWNKTLLFSQIY